MIYRALSIMEVLVLVCVVAKLLPRPVGPAATVGRKTALRPMDWAVAAYLLAAALGAALVEDTGSAVLELRTVFLFPALLYLLIRTTSLDMKATTRIENGWALGAAAVAIIGILYYGLGTQVALGEAGITPIVTDIETIEEAVRAYLDGEIVNHTEWLH